MNTIYTVYKGRIEAHDLVRETKTGYTVLANWSNKVTTEHLRKSEKKPTHSFNFYNKYTTYDLGEAVKLCEDFQDNLKCYIRDSESDVMNKDKFI